MSDEKIIELSVDDEFEFALYTIVADEKGRIKLIFDEDGIDCMIVQKFSLLPLGTDEVSEPD